MRLAHPTIPFETFNRSVYRRFSFRLRTAPRQAAIDFLCGSSTFSASGHVLPPAHALTALPGIAFKTQTSRPRTSREHRKKRLAAVKPNTYAFSATIQATPQDPSSHHREGACQKQLEVRKFKATDRRTKTRSPTKDPVLDHNTRTEGLRIKQTQCLHGDHNTRQKTKFFCFRRGMPDRNSTNQPRINSFRRFCTA